MSIEIKENFDSNSVTFKMEREGLLGILEMRSIHKAEEMLAEAIVKKFGSKILNGIKIRHVKNTLKTLVAKRLENEIQFVIKK